jgi:hypothetical protein
MRQFVRFILLVVSFYAFGYSLTKALSYWDYDKALPNISELMHAQVSAEQMNQEVGKAINEDRLEDAKMYLNIARHYDYPLEYDYYQAHIEQKDTQERRIKKNLKGFAEGFIDGKGSDGAGIAGAITADFTVIGDVRDLYHQYGLYEQGKEVNELIVALAGVGVGLTALTVGSGGSAAPAKGGVSLLKLASKTRRLTARFSKELMQHARRVFDLPTFTRMLRQGNKLTDLRRAAKASFNPAAIKPLQDMAEQMNNIRKTTSVADTLHVMRYVENGDDLRRLEKFAVKHGAETKGILKFLGKGALRSVRVLRKTGALLLSIAGVVLSGFFSLLFLFARVATSSK